MWFEFFATTTDLVDVVIGLIVNRQNLPHKFFDGSPKAQRILSVVKIGQSFWIVHASFLQNLRQIVCFPAVSLIVFLHEVNMSWRAEKKLRSRLAD